MYEAPFTRVLSRTIGRSIPRNIARTGVSSAAFSPSDIAGLTVWLDADDPTTLLNASLAPAAADEAVRQWSDKSGNNHHAIQATVANQPLRKTNVLNSRAGLLADSSNDQMFITNTAALAALNNTITHFFVIKLAPTTTFNLIDQKRQSSSPAAGLQVQNDSGTPNKLFLRIDANGDTAAYTTSSGERPTAFDGNAHLVSYRLNSGAVVMEYDGTRVTNSSYTHTLGFGNTQDWRVVNGTNGHYFERIVYSGALSDSEMSQVTTYLRNKWGI